MSKLPLCAKVDDKLSRGSLLKDGWRPIGELLTYQGDVGSGKIDPKIESIDSTKTSYTRYIVDLAKQIKWTGRLWRDSKVEDADAWAETEKLIKTSQDIKTIGSAAFGIFLGNRVLLIGIHPNARGLGLAKRLLRGSVKYTLVAGTYSDNEDANRLYRSLDMKVVKKQYVFHKDQT